MKRPVDDNSEPTDEQIAEAAMHAAIEDFGGGMRDLKPLLDRLIINRPHVSHAARLAIADMQSGNAANCPG